MMESQENSDWLAITDKFETLYLIIQENKYILPPIGSEWIETTPFYRLVNQRKNNLITIFDFIPQSITSVKNMNLKKFEKRIVLSEEDLIKSLSLSFFTEYSNIKTLLDNTSSQTKTPKLIANGTIPQGLGLFSNIDKKNHVNFWVNHYSNLDELPSKFTIYQSERGI